jgi:hypothetical protein
MGKYTPIMRTKARIADDFYEGLLGTCMDREGTINLTELGLIALDLADLEQSFTEEEVWAIIKQLPSDKALQVAFTNPAGQ